MTTMATVIPNNHTHPYNFTIHDIHHADELRTGPLPEAWNMRFENYCLTNMSTCDVIFTPIGMTVIGYCMVGVAFVLGIVLFHDRLKKLKMRFGYYHDSIRFVTKFLSLLGFYFLFFGSLLGSNNRQQATKYGLVMFTCSGAMIIMVPIILLSTFRYWCQIRKWHIQDNRPTTILVEAGDVFQNFIMPTIKVTAVGVTQFLLILIYIYAVAGDIVERVDTATYQYKVVYPAYIISSVMQASYNVGCDDFFENIHSQTHFWLEGLFFNRGRAVTIKNEESSDNIRMPKIAILTRLLLSFTVNMVGAAYVTAKISTPSGSGCTGEVWIYLDDDDKEVQKLFASSADATADSSADDDDESDDVNGKEIVGVDKIISNFCSSSRLDNTLDLTSDV